MPRRRATLGLSTDLIKLGQLCGQAWHGAKTIQRRYPRMFAAALADAMQLEGEQAESFISTMEKEYVGILNADTERGRGFR